MIGPICFSYWELRESCCVYLRVDFPSRYYSVQTHVKFTRVNEMDAMYGRSRVSDDYTLKLNLAQLLGLRVTFYTLSLFYLRAYARKKLRDSGNQR